MGRAILIAFWPGIPGYVWLLRPVALWQLGATCALLSKASAAVLLAHGSPAKPTIQHVSIPAAGSGAAQVLRLTAEEVRWLPPHLRGNHMRDGW